MCVPRLCFFLSVRRFVVQDDAAAAGGEDDGLGDGDEDQPTVLVMDDGATATLYRAGGGHPVLQCCYLDSGVDNNALGAVVSLPSTSADSPLLTSIGRVSKDVDSGDTNTQQTSGSSCIATSPSSLSCSPHHLTTSRTSLTSSTTSHSPTPCSGLPVRRYSARTYSARPPSRPALLAAAPAVAKCSIARLRSPVDSLSVVALAGHGDGSEAKGNTDNNGEQNNNIVSYIANASPSGTDAQSGAEPHKLALSVIPSDKKRANISSCTSVFNNRFVFSKNDISSLRYTEQPKINKIIIQPASIVGRPRNISPPNTQEILSTLGPKQQQQALATVPSGRPTSTARVAAENSSVNNANDRKDNNSNERSFLDARVSQNFADNKSVNNNIISPNINLTISTSVTRCTPCVLTGAAITQLGNTESRVVTPISASRSSLNENISGKPIILHHKLQPTSSLILKLPNAFSFELPRQNVEATLSDSLGDSASDPLSDPLSNIVVMGGTGVATVFRGAEVVRSLAVSYATPIMQQVYLHATPQAHEAAGTLAKTETVSITSPNLPGLASTVTIIASDNPRLSPLSYDNLRLPPIEGPHFDVALGLSKTASVTMSSTHSALTSAANVTSYSPETSLQVAARVKLEPTAAEAGHDDIKTESVSY